MSHVIQFKSRRSPLTSCRGAVEIETFDDPAANDNGHETGNARKHRHAAWGLPVITLMSGLTAALVIAATAHVLGFAS